MKIFKKDSEFFFRDIETNRSFTLVEIEQVDCCKVEHFSYTVYYKSGKKHRVDGPAMIWYKDINDKTITDVDYWFEGRCYPFDEWFLQLSKEQRQKYLFNIGNIDERV